MKITRGHTIFILWIQDHFKQRVQCTDSQILTMFWAVLGSPPHNYYYYCLVYVNINGSSFIVCYLWDDNECLRCVLGNRFFTLLGYIFFLKWGCWTLSQSDRATFVPNKIRIWIFSHVFWLFPTRWQLHRTQWFHEIIGLYQS